MRAVYINLDTAAERRALLEASFARVPQAGWELARFPAVTAAEAAAAPGAILPTEKACFESHRRVIAQSLADDRPLFVLEDDVAFSQIVFPFLSAVADHPGDWDLLFTDVALIQAGHMMRIARQREELARESEVSILPLRGVYFASAAAYLVRASSKAKLHGLLQEPRALDLPYDIYLQELSASGRLNVSACAPFLTTLAPVSGQSQIKEHPLLQHRAMDAFRRLMFVERDMAACNREAAGLRAEAPEPARLLGDILGALSLSD